MLNYIIIFLWSSSMMGEREHISNYNLIGSYTVF